MKGEEGRVRHPATLVWRDGESERGFTNRKMSNADKERCKDAAKSAQHFKILGDRVHVTGERSQVTSEP